MPSIMMALENAIMAFGINIVDSIGRRPNDKAKRHLYVNSMTFSGANV